MVAACLEMCRGRSQTRVLDFISPEGGQSNPWWVVPSQRVVAHHLHSVSFQPSPQLPHLLRHHAICRRSRECHHSVVLLTLLQYNHPWISRRWHLRCFLILVWQHKLHGHQVFLLICDHGCCHCDLFPRPSLGDHRSSHCNLFPRCFGDHRSRHCYLLGFGVLRSAEESNVVHQDSKSTVLIAFEF